MQKKGDKLYLTYCVLLSTSDMVLISRTLEILLSSALPQHVDCGIVCGFACLLFAATDIAVLQLAAADAEDLNTTPAA